MFHGHEDGSVRLQGERVGLAHHRAGQETPRHAHAAACLHVVLRGVYVEHSRTGTVVACPGDVVFKQPEVEHWNLFGTVGAETLRCELTSEWKAAGIGTLLTTDRIGLERCRRVGRALRRSAHDVRASTLAAIAPQTELLDFLRRHFRERIVLSDVARCLHVDRSHLTRQFTRDFGASPQNYVACKRVAWTAERLALGASDLADIALAAGFCDESHCIRTFKRLLGLTPLRWSRRVRW